MNLIGGDFGVFEGLLDYRVDSLQPGLHSFSAFGFLSRFAKLFELRIIVDDSEHFCAAQIETDPMCFVVFSHNLKLGRRCVKEVLLFRRYTITCGSKKQKSMLAFVKLIQSFKWAGFHSNGNLSRGRICNKRWNRLEIIPCDRQYEPEVQARSASE